MFIAQNSVNYLNSSYLEPIGERKMPILAEYKEGKFIPLENIKLNNGDIVELALLPKKKFLWKGALNSIKTTSVELQHKIKELW